MRILLFYASLLSLCVPCKVQSPWCTGAFAAKDTLMVWLRWPRLDAVQAARSRRPQVSSERCPWRFRVYAYEQRYVYIYIYIEIQSTAVYIFSYRSISFSVSVQLFYASLLSLRVADSVQSPSFAGEFTEKDSCAVRLCRPRLVAV